MDQDYIGKVIEGVLAIEIETGEAEYGPPQPGQKLDNFLAFQLPQGARILYCVDGQEKPGIFDGMVRSDEGYLATIYLDDASEAPSGLWVKSWTLKLEGPDA